MIRRASLSDVSVAAGLASLLWEGSANEYIEMFSELISSSKCAVFIDFDGDTPAGFAQCQLRHDYVEGTDSSPVGYLEGIFVREEYRRQGRARALLNACERWTESQGCTEFASDCELENEASPLFHLRMGFIEANRIICFTKQLAKE